MLGNKKNVVNEKQSGDLHTIIITTTIIIIIIIIIKIIKIIKIIIIIII